MTFVIPLYGFFFFFFETIFKCTRNVEHLMQSNLAPCVEVISYNMLIFLDVPLSFRLSMRMTHAMEIEIIYRHSHALRVRYAKHSLVSRLPCV